VFGAIESAEDADVFFDHCLKVVRQIYASLQLHCKYANSEHIGVMGFKKVGGAQCCSSPTNTANFRQRLWVLRIPILHINFSKWGFSVPYFAFMRNNFFTKRIFSDNFLTAKSLG